MSDSFVTITRQFRKGSLYYSWKKYNHQERSQETRKAALSNKHKLPSYLGFLSENIYSTLISLQIQLLEKKIYVYTELQTTVKGIYF